MLKLCSMNEAEIRCLYHQSLSRDFPVNELKSLSVILSMHQKGLYDVLGAYQDGRMIAYALIYRPPEGRLALLDYFAVEPAFRSKGIGGRFLSQLRQHYASMIDVLMVECEWPEAAPNEYEAHKRIRFYIQAGAILTSVRIWLFGVEYTILVFPCTEPVPALDWADRMMHLYRQMLPEELYLSNVSLIKS